MICCESDLRKIGHEREQQHREGGNDEVTGHHERDSDKCGFQNCPADFVNDPGEHTLVDDPPLLDERHDVNQPLFRQDNARSPLGNVSRSTHGDSHLGLAQGWRVVDAVPRHADHVPRGL